MKRIRNRAVAVRSQDTVANKCDRLKTTLCALAAFMVARHTARELQAGTTLPNRIRAK